MERFFYIRDWWGNGLALWVVVLLMLSIPVLAVVIKDVDLENDVTNWLPSDDPEAVALTWFTSQFERDDRVLVSWDSSTLVDRRMQRFAESLRENGINQIPAIRDVVTPREVLDRMIDDNNVAPEDAIERITGIFIGHGFLKVQLTEAGRSRLEETQKAIRAATREVVGKRVELLSAVTVPDEDLELESEDEEPLPFEMPAHDFQLRWSGISATNPIAESVIEQLSELSHDGQSLVERAFFAPGSPAAVAISLNPIDDGDLNDALTSIIERAVKAGVPSDEIRLAGSPISRARLNQEARRAIWNTDYPIWNLYKRTPILLSAVVGVVVSFLLLKSLRLSLLVTASSMFTCMVVVALIPMTGKSLNMVLIVLPDLLLVLTTSGAIHVANYWKNAVMHDEPHPIATAVKMAWKPCVLASATTAIGMASLLTAVLEPVREFGLYAAVGCFASLFMILIGFPSLMSVWPGRKQKFSEHADKEATVWGHFARYIVHHRLSVYTACLVLFVFSVYGLRWFQTETKVIRYFPPETRISQDYHYLEEGLTGIVPLDIVISFRPEVVDRLDIDERIEVVRRVEEEVAKHPGVSGTLSLADFRDPFKKPSENASSAVRIRYKRSLQRKEEVIFEGEEPSIQEFARKATVKLELPSLGGRPVDIHADEEIWRIRVQTVVTGDVDYSVLTSELNTLVAEQLQGEEGADYLVTGMVPLFLRTQQAVLESLINSFALAFGVIAIVMIGVLRNPISGVLAMLPNLFPVGVVFGLVAWMGIPVDIGTMITASVALGIAIDGTLHLLTWFQDGIRQGCSREDSIVLALQHSGPAMWQTSASIALGIVMLSGAELLLISRFGLLMAGLVGMALIADVILLPALLGGMMGKIIEKHTKPSDKESTETPATLEFPTGANSKSTTPAEHRHASL
ncbi:MMPL family transporter [Thalassoglobus sp. JC818]|uniref:efflux RND transporter permease subunit n=1 Tax=Thalassoglobus sp. JC818 TaxID=3232136 RepID=UPI0034590B59